MPSPLKSVHDKITLIGGSHHISELEMSCMFMNDEALKKYILEEFGFAIATEIAKNPDFIIQREDEKTFERSTKFKASVGVIFDLKSFEETLRTALSAEYTHGYKRALEERAAKELEGINVLLSEANELRTSDE